MVGTNKFEEKVSPSRQEKRHTPNVEVHWYHTQRYQICYEGGWGHEYSRTIISWL